MNDKALELLEKYAIILGQKLSELAATYGQETIDIVFALVRLEGVRHLAAITLLALATVGLLTLAFRVVPWCRKHENNSDGASWVVAILFYLGGTATTVIAFLKLFDFGRGLPSSVPSFTLPTRYLLR